MTWKILRILVFNATGEVESNSIRIDGKIIEVKIEHLIDVSAALEDGWEPFSINLEQLCHNEKLAWFNVWYFKSRNDKHEIIQQVLDAQS